jgi:uncharacterized protein YdeI (YjbR/CyaY-like superfamily)
MGQVEMESDQSGELALPEDLASALEGAPAAKELFDALTPSYRKQWIAWITGAEEEEMRAERLKEAVTQMAAGAKQPT